MVVYEQDLAVGQGGASARVLRLLEELLLMSNRSPRRQYVGHRFTNGPVYSEYVAQELGVPLISYAESRNRCSRSFRSLALFG